MLINIHLLIFGCNIKKIQFSFLENSHLFYIKTVDFSIAEAIFHIKGELQMDLYIYPRKRYFKDELPVSVGEYTVGTNHWPLDPGKFHKREFWKITAVLPKNTDQEETIVCNGKKTDVRSGIIYLVHPDDLTTGWISRGTIIMNILVLNDFIQDVAKDLYSTTDFFRIFESDPPENSRFLHYTPLVPNLMRLLKRISFETKHTDANTPIMLKYLLGEFLVEFQRNYYLHQNLIRSQKLVPETQKILREKYREKISIETIAQHFGVSEQYLHSRFRKTTGHTIKEYLNELRLAYAVKNLENTQLCISEIRQRSGFPNPNCFFTVFRRKFGCTPQEYRDKRSRKEAK